MKATRTEFLDACLRAANAIGQDCYPNTPAEGLAVMMPGATEVSTEELALGVAVFRDAKLGAQALEDR